MYLMFQQRAQARTNDNRVTDRLIAFPFRSSSRVIYAPCSLRCCLASPVVIPHLTHRLYLPHLTSNTSSAHKTSSPSATLINLIVSSVSSLSQADYNPPRLPSSFRPATPHFTISSHRQHALQVQGRAPLREAQGRS